MDFFSGTPVSLQVDFRDPLGTRVPDAGSVSYSLYSGIGLSIQMNVPLAPEADASGVLIDIPAIDNVIAPDRRFERRQVIVFWRAGGLSFHTPLNYRLVPLPAHGVMPEDVRVLLGLNSDELRDEEVDMFGAYLRAEADVGGTFLLDALQSGTILELAANRLIAYTAAQALLPGLGQRIAQEKGDGTQKFVRLRSIDLKQLAADINGQRQLDIGAINGSSDVVTVIPLFVLLAGPAIDPVTGAAPV